MIKLFNDTDTTFNTNGDVVLNPTYAVVHKEDNGDYYLDLETNLTNETKVIDPQPGTTITIDDTTQITADGNKEVEITSLYGNTSQNVLPSEYTKVEYIESTGTQYIDTGVIGASDLEAEVKVSFNEIPNDCCLLGSRNVNDRFYVFYIYPGKFNIGYYNNYYNSNVTPVANQIYNMYTKLYNGDQKLDVDGTTLVSKSENRDINTTKNLYLFCNNMNGPSYYSKAKLYSLTIKKDGVLVRNFIPCYRNSDNVIGLYDVVTNTFFTNNGTGTFGKGNNDTAPLPNPNYPLEMANVKGENEIVITGKNILNLSNKTQYTYNGITYEVNNNVFTFSGTNTSSTSYGLIYFADSTTRKYYDNIFSKNKGNTFTLSTNNNLSGLYFQFNYHKQGSTSQTGLVTYVLSSNKQTFTIPNDFDRVASIFMGVYGTATTIEGSFSLQLEYGDKTSFIPYEKHTYTINLGDINLRGIGNYKDKIYKNNNKWYLHKVIGDYTITGNENWQKGSSFYCMNILPTTGMSASLGQNCLSTYFRYSNNAFGANSIFVPGSVGSETKNLWLQSSNFENATALKSWLTTHNVLVYYVQKYTTETEITDETLISQLESLRLLNGINNITITSNGVNGSIDLHYDFVTGGEISTNDFITSNKILVANTPTGNQAFRITNIDKTRKKIKLIAKHISYDSENYVIQDSYVVDKTCNQALDHLNDATDNESPFTMTSDITSINSYRCVRKSLWEAIQVVLERWGGHLTRNNWNIGIMNSIGADNGVVVRYAKNLKNIDVQYDWSQVVTKILPVGQDGLLLDEIYLYSDTQYEIPYTKVVHFNQDIDESLYYDENGNLDEDAYTEALKADLRNQANAYLQIHYIPQVNYELNANLEKITDIGDTIQVIDERLGVDLLTNLIAYDYDCILERYKTLEFGNFRKNLTNLTTYIDTQTNQIVEDNIAVTKVTLQNELQTATSQIWGVLGSSYVLNEGDKILVVDSLPKETATNVIMINSAGIGFSQTGINGTFSTALTIDGTFNTSNVNVINFTADLIKGGVLKLGSNLNQNGILEVYDEANNLIAQLDKNGLRMNAVNGAYVLINQQVGFAGYDRNNNPIYWVSEDEFHMKKSVVEEEITLVDKMRIIPITITDNGTIVNDGIGFVSTL